MFENSLNTARIILVALAAFAAVVAAFIQLWVVAAVLGVAVLAHGAMWVWLYLQREREAAEAPQR